MAGNDRAVLKLGPVVGEFVEFLVTVSTGSRARHARRAVCRKTRSIGASCVPFELAFRNKIQGLAFTQDITAGYTNPAVAAVWDDEADRLSGRRDNVTGDLIMTGRGRQDPAALLLVALICTTTLIPVVFPICLGSPIVGRRRQWFLSRA